MRSVFDVAFCLSNMEPLLSIMPMINGCKQCPSYRGEHNNWCYGRKYGKFCAFTLLTSLSIVVFIPAAYLNPRNVIPDEQFLLCQTSVCTS